MDSLIGFAKENFQLISLGVGILGVIVGVISVVYEMNKRQKKQNDDSTPSASAESD